MFLGSTALWTYEPKAPGRKQTNKKKNRQNITILSNWKGNTSIPILLQYLMMSDEKSHSERRRNRPLRPYNKQLINLVITGKTQTSVLIIMNAKFNQRREIRATVHDWGSFYSQGLLANTVSFVFCLEGTTFFTKPEHTTIQPDGEIFFFQPGTDHYIFLIKKSVSFFILFRRLNWTYNKPAASRYFQVSTKFCDYFP